MCNGRARDKEFERIFHTCLLTRLQTEAVYQYRIAGGDDTWTFVANPSKGHKVGARRRAAVWG